MTNRLARRRRFRTLRVFAAMLVVCAFGVGDTAVWAQGDGDQPGAEDLASHLDAILALAPAHTCFTLAVDGTPIYSHNGERDLIPASNQKLITAGAALHVLGAEHTFRTRALAAAEPSGGVIDGDLVLVGGGDPLLVTDMFRVVDRIADEQHPTRFEDLAEQIVAAGITRITGSVVGDESRYDSARTVATWPERYVSQRQSGPLSALTVDDGYRIDLPPPDSEGPPVWHRTDSPAAHAAQALHAHLAIRGVEIVGSATVGTADGRDVEVASVSSAPLSDVLEQFLVDSDNQTGELILKELDVQAGGAGTTDGGIEAVGDTLDDLGLARGDVTITDGSGLDRGNRISCDDLVALLDATGGADGTIADALPVAASNGTLRRRFADTPLAGELRAKTGRLDDVTSLAGFTPMAGDEVATFAYISNGETVDADLMAIQEQLLLVTSLHHRPCTDGVPPPMPVPVGPLAGQASLLGLATGPVVVASTTLAPLPTVASHPAFAPPGCGGRSTTVAFEPAPDTHGS